MLTLPEHTTIVEVGPRDGLQSLDRWIPTETKVEMIDLLSAVGFPVIEVTSLAHPRVVPHLRDAEEVLIKIKRRPGTVYRVLVPNAKGAERAVNAGVDEMLGLIPVSETYCRKNQNMSVADAIEQVGLAFGIASRASKEFLVALSMAFVCPYEGRIPERQVMEVFGQLHDRGIRRVYLAATVGLEEPRHVGSLFQKVLARWPDAQLGFHVHNLAGFGLANVLAALDAGALWVEGAICGLGGGIVLPGAIGNTGNVATEDLVHLLNSTGVRTGLDTSAVIQVAEDIGRLLGVESSSYATRTPLRADISTSQRPSAPDERPFTDPQLRSGRGTR